MLPELQQNPKVEAGAPNPAVRAPDRVYAAWRLADRPERPSPYGVQWRTPTGKPKLYFKTPELRDTKLAELERRAGQRQDFTPSEAAAARALLDAIGDTPWQDVVAGWREHMASTGRTPCLLTVQEAAKEFLSTVEALPVSSGYRTHIRQKVGLFAQAFGANRMSEVTAEDIESWLDDDLGLTVNGTFNMYRKMVRMLYAHFAKQLKNPCDHIKPRSEVVEKVEVLSVRETAQLFAYALKHRREAIGRLALEAFAGLRFSSAFRLEKADINFADRGILLPAHKLKTGRRHYIDGLPDNLWAWLAKTTPACWALENSAWMHLKSDLFIDAKVPHPRNCLRHGFCTYHVAAYKNPQLTSTILCHRNTQKLWSNYHGVATQADGKLYFTITPQRVLGRSFGL